MDNCLCEQLSNLLRCIFCFEKYKYYQCSLCQHGFKNRFILNKHMKEKHSEIFSFGHSKNLRNDYNQIYDKVTKFDWVD